MNNILDLLLLIFAVCLFGDFLFRWYKWRDYFSKRYLAFSGVLVLINLFDYFKLFQHIPNLYLLMTVRIFSLALLIGLIYRLIQYSKTEDIVLRQIQQIKNNLEDTTGNCKQCGHPFEGHTRMVIAYNKHNLSKGGEMRCPVKDCSCVTRMDFNLNQKSK